MCLALAINDGFSCRRSLIIHRLQNWKSVWKRFHSALLKLVRIYQSAVISVMFSSSRGNKMLWLFLFLVWNINSLTNTWCFDEGTSNEGTVHTVQLYLKIYLELNRNPDSKRMDVFSEQQFHHLLGWLLGINLKFVDSFHLVIVLQIKARAFQEALGQTKPRQLIQ